jgi:hypothetical protein
MEEERYESIHNNIIPQQSKAEAVGRNKFSASSCRGLEKQKLAMKILQTGFHSDSPRWEQTMQGEMQIIFLRFRASIMRSSL